MWKIYNSFSKNLEKIKKLSQISYIEYFGNSIKDIKDENTLKTCEIFKSKILQIDGYFNERGTLFSEYLFGLLNNAKREVKKDDKINDILPGNRNSLNIFLFGEARAGKSRFINLSMNNLVSRENCSSSHVTKKFTKYALPMSNNENGELGQIVLYDSPGLTEDKDVVKEFKNLVESTLNIFKEKKENNSILLYFIKRGGGISNNILNFVKFLNDKKFNILFVITHSKKGSVITNNYRNEIISQLKLNNTFTDINLKKLNNDGENIISVNLKEDSDTGEFYGLRDIYREILKIFPENFIDEIENNNFNDLNQLFGFIAYKKYFFLNNVLTKDDFLKKISYKIDREINIAAHISSLAGLTPIPFGDIPIILFLEVGIIKYTAKLCGFKDNDYNIIKLMTFNTGGLTLGTIMKGVSTVLLFSELLDLIPICGQFISVITNPCIIKSFWYFIKSYFLEKITDEKLRNIIKFTLDDYKSIYLQIKQLCDYENNSVDNIKENGGNNKIEFIFTNENIKEINHDTNNYTHINNIQKELVNINNDIANKNLYLKSKFIYKKKIVNQNKFNILNKNKDNEEEKNIGNNENRKDIFKKKKEYFFKYH